MTEPASASSSTDQPSTAFVPPAADDAADAAPTAAVAADVADVSPAVFATAAASVSVDAVAPAKGTTPTPSVASDIPTPPAPQSEPADLPPAVPGAAPTPPAQPVATPVADPFAPLPPAEPAAPFSFDLSLEPWQSTPPASEYLGLTPPAQPVSPTPAVPAQQAATGPVSRSPQTPAPSAVQAPPPTAGYTPAPSVSAAASPDFGYVPTPNYAVGGTNFGQSAPADPPVGAGFGDETYETYDPNRTYTPSAAPAAAAMGYGQTPPPGQTLPGYGTGGPAAYGTPPAGAYTQPPIGNVGSVPPPYQPTDQYGQPIPQAGPVAYGSAYPVVATNSLTPLIPGSVVQTAYGPRLVGGKSKLAAGLLGIFLGGLGVGRFYRGFVGLGILQILASLFFGAGVIWGFIEGIIVLVSQPGSPSSLDSEGNLLQ